MATPTQPEIERRVFDCPCELRDDDSSPNEPRLIGHAALFNTDTEIFPGLIERISPGAFARALDEKQDVRALVDHDPSKVIGRTKADTLFLKEDRKGLLADILPSDTTAGNDITESVRRGDVDQMSFGFIARKETWEDHEDGSTTRTIEDVDLFDVSPVTFPAYPDTDIAVRSMEAHKAGSKPAKGSTNGTQAASKPPKAATRVEVTADTTLRHAKIASRVESESIRAEYLEPCDKCGEPKGCLCPHH